MTYEIIPHPDVESIFMKMGKKDSVRFNQLVKKLRELGENPEIGKPLHSPMQGLRRLHIGHYVLTYKLDKKKEQITIVDYAHHDEVY
ncbi:MAG: type II toxin-antitoxin system RelE/ParE family toxin [Methanoregula sp.]|nr:type II toxin-antitoxin system RelE/ParE family toxin [Methanoregula sp.]